MLTILSPTRVRSVLLAVLFSLGCTAQAPKEAPPFQVPPDADINTDAGLVGQQQSFISAQAHLARIAITLTGQRPTLLALDDIQRTPSNLENWVDQYLDTPGFGLTVRQMYNEALSLKALLTLFPPRSPLAQETFASLNNSVQQAPLRLVEHVVMEERPFSEIVTANYTMADATVAAVWGLEHSGEPSSWIETQWPGLERSHAGLLTEEYLFVRHYTTPLNAQRGRANVLSNALLCHDYLAQDIAIDANLDLSDASAVNQAVRAPACAGCHESLDPFAANFWAYEFFTLPATIETYPYSHHRPEYLMYRRYFTDRDPGYLNNQTENLEALGRAIADDPRFYRCAVKRFYAFFTQRRIQDVSREVVDRFLIAFEESGYNAKALAKAIVVSDEFKRAHSPQMLMRPYALNEAVTALDGFQWRFEFAFPMYEEYGVTANYGSVDLLTDGFVGFGVLAGGTDDFVVKQSRHSMNPMRSLVYTNLAQAFASQIVERAELATEDNASSILPTPLGDVRADAVKISLKRLVGRLYSTIVDEEHEDVERLWSLFESAMSISQDPARAWSVVLTAMLQDDRFYYY